MSGGEETDTTVPLNVANGDTVLLSLVEPKGSRAYTGPESLIDIMQRYIKKKEI